MEGEMDFLNGPVVTQPPPTPGGIISYGAGAPFTGTPVWFIYRPFPDNEVELPSKRGEWIGSLFCESDEVFG